MSKIICIYHKDCIDGTAAAAVVLHKFPEAICYPLNHHYSPEDLSPILEQVESDTVIYTVDCAIAVPEFLKLNVKVITIDHHISVEPDCRSLVAANPNYTYHFDNTKSGATLTWSTLFPTGEMPKALTLIEDNDIGVWQYGEDTTDANHYLYMFVNEPILMLDEITSDFANIKNGGALLTKSINKEVSMLLSIKPVTIRIDDHTVNAYNISTHVSECARHLYKKHNDVVVLFAITGDRVKLSFRSPAGQTPTALDLATLLGGGGHVCAAGASISLKEFLQILAL